jgi:hypothetical protein
MHTCLGKIKGEDGSMENCPCLRHIPEPIQPTSGPQICRDCRHWESMHPELATMSSGTVQGVLATMKPRIEAMRKQAVSEAEARLETNAGFRKASTDDSGRGGQSKSGGRGGETKFQVCDPWPLTAMET